MELQEISLQLVNIDVLERSTKPNCLFGIEGGSIGSAFSDHWSLFDRTGRVVANHAHIKIIDDQFCIQQGEADVYVNKSNYPLGKGKWALLHDTDNIELGQFLLQVHFSHDNHFKADPNASLEEVLGDEEQTFLLVDNGWNKTEKLRVIENTDPEAALDEVMVKVGNTDPEQFLIDQARSKVEKNNVVELIEGVDIEDISYIHQPTAHFDKTTEQNSGFELHENELSNGVAKVKNDFNSKMEDLEDLVMGASQDNVDLSVSENNTSASVHLVDEANHLAASPLQRGLGVALKQTDSADTYDVLEEVGSTLKEAIQGLLTIQESSKKEGQGLSNKILQPIEDNPLRLGLDYKSTMSALFDNDRSMVHLSAPMAVKESLHQIHLHQIATTFATQKALDAILQALNPKTLANRFQRYRGNNQSDDSSHGWAWEMYTHYYAELISSRQQGFEKLYSEVFEQAYDQKLRELQADGQEYA